MHRVQLFPVRCTVSQSPCGARCANPRAVHGVPIPVRLLTHITVYIPITKHWNRPLPSHQRSTFAARDPRNPHPSSLRLHSGFMSPSRHDPILIRLYHLYLKPLALSA
jgi:hypothetical protein